MFSCTTIDVDSGGVVVDPDDVFGQAGVVARMIQTNPLNVKAAVLPHFYILVCGHLTEQKGYPGSSKPSKKRKRPHCVLLPSRSCATTVWQAVDSLRAGHMAK